jgi:uncharacterized protein (DUF1697 family)
MPVVIAMLRGVNLGGNNLIKMDALRSLVESLGFQDVTTFIQSGNVVFRTKEQDLDAVGKRIGDGIEKGFGFRPGIVLRTADEMLGVIARNPFAGRKDIDPARLLVWFLPEIPGAEARQKALALAGGQPEELHIIQREGWIYFPHGQARSRLLPAVDKALKISGTGRNWNSVLKLMKIAEKLG